MHVQVAECELPCSRYKTGKHFTVTITDHSLAIARKQDQIDATTTLYITGKIRRFGDWVVDLKPPNSSTVTSSTCSREYCSPPRLL